MMMMQVDRMEPASVALVDDSVASDPNLGTRASDGCSQCPVFLRVHWVYRKYSDPRNRG